MRGDERHPDAVLHGTLHSLFQSRPELRNKIIARTRTAGRISIGKAAEMTDVSHKEMKEI